GKVLSEVQWISRDPAGGIRCTGTGPSGNMAPGYADVLAMAYPAGRSGAGGKECHCRVAREHLVAATRYFEPVWHASRLAFADQSRAMDQRRPVALCDGCDAQERSANERLHELAVQRTVAERSRQ
ncbi:MAG: hypothetical protein WCP55_19715, partial [Lentisphaerota bacterium]